MKRLLLIAGLVAATVVVPAQAARASWVSNNCYTSNASDSNVRRLDAKAYAEVGKGEGYEWGEGCWNDNCSSDKVAVHFARQAKSD